MTLINLSRSYFHWKSLAIIFASWTLIGFLTANRHYLVARPSGGGGRWGEAVLGILVSYAWPWALVTPLIFYLADRFSLRQGRIRRHLTLHCALGLLLALLLVAIEVIAAGLLSNNGLKPE